MIAAKLKFFLNWLLVYSNQKQKGFTLVEILMSIIIGGIIITGLLAVVVELLTTNNREVSRTETQREMQMALDFIAAELREAVHIYDGNCLQQQDDPYFQKKPNGSLCSGIIRNNYIPTPANSTPILVFWKLDNLPEKVKNFCQAGNTGPAARPYPCLAGKSYTLVAYFLTRNQPTETAWKGKARIQRFELPAYDKDGNPIRGYADPIAPGMNFNRWPLNDKNVNQQTGSVLPAAPTTLVDFVDDSNLTTLSQNQGTAGTGTATVQCPNGYALTPSDNTLNTFSFSQVRNFYGCVRIPDDLIPGSSNSTGAFNQKVILFLRGNASGKPGIKEDNQGFLPAIATQVLNRGVKDKQPLRD